MKIRIRKKQRQRSKVKNLPTLVQPKRDLSKHKNPKQTKVKTSTGDQTIPRGLFIP